MWFYFVPREPTVEFCRGLANRLAAPRSSQPPAACSRIRQSAPDRWNALVTGRCGYQAALAASRSCEPRRNGRLWLLFIVGELHAMSRFAGEWLSVDVISDSSRMFHRGAALGYILLVSLRVLTHDTGTAYLPHHLAAFFPSKDCPSHSGEWRRPLNFRP